ncbi:PRC-barrel domain-containing protein [Streptomyces xantholiticus]|uniref:PRC-barrel domain-containing protein n=1 Tax=Streptomyces xantholiticus TaxID=68285 RepID=A0ABV1UZX1_9ACTN
MITKAQIRDVLDHPVYDADGNKIGNAKHVFLDDATGEPDWVSVRTGLFGSSESFVPIRDAHMVEDHLEVPYPKDRIKDAPNVDVDAGGHLSAEEEQRLYRHYSIDWNATWKGANQPSEEGRDDSGTAGAAGAAGAGGAAGAAGTAEGSPAGSGQGMAGETPAHGRAAEGEPLGRDLSGNGRDMAGRHGGDDTDVARTGSEETMRVGTERNRVGRARLRKYVAPEEEQ